MLEIVHCCVGCRGSWIVDRGASIELGSDPKMICWVGNIIRQNGKLPTFQKVT